MEGIKSYPLRNNPVTEDLMEVMEEKVNKAVSEATRSEEITETLSANASEKYTDVNEAATMMDFTKADCLKFQ